MADSDNDSGGAYGVIRGSCSEFPGNREQDRYLPIANVSRIMKKALPANGKISKEAKETVQECVSEFISFITGEASDKCQKEKRKTINGDDILWAMTTLGFDDYVEPLKVYLQKYREMEGERTTLTDRQQVDQRDHGANGGESTSTGGLSSGFSGGFERSTGRGDAAVYGQSGEQSTELMMMMSHHAHGNHQRHIYGSGNGRKTSSGRTR